jgi:hypothetical protein
VNNPTLTEFCFGMIGRADIEGSKSNVAMNAWLPQASYPCGTVTPTSVITKVPLGSGLVGPFFLGLHLWRARLYLKLRYQQHSLGTDHHIVVELHP